MGNDDNNGVVWLQVSTIIYPLLTQKKHWYKNNITEQNVPYHKGKGHYVIGNCNLSVPNSNWKNNT